MQRVQHDVKGRRYERTRNPEQSRASRPQPRRTNLASFVQVVRPIRRKPAHVQGFHWHPGIYFQRKQSVFGRNIVGAGVDARFQQGSCRALRQVHNRQTALVPASGSAQSSRSLQVTMLAHAPKRGQTNMPSSICTSSSSTMRLPVSVFAISRGVRLCRRGWERRSQASARSRDP